MSKSNLSADAQCFVPSKENKQNKFPLGNRSAESYNYFGHTNYARNWYDMTLCPSFHVNQPYVVPLFNNFYPNDDQVPQFHTVQTPQRGVQQHFLKSKTVLKTSQENQTCEANKEKIKHDGEDIRNFQEGRVIISKSSKKRKAKKNKVSDVSGEETLNLREPRDDDVEASSSHPTETKESMKSTRSWSEVVSRGCLVASGDLAPSTSRDETPTPAKGKISENGKSGKVKPIQTSQKNEGRKIKEANVENDSSNKSLSNKPQKIKILQRNEKLEDIAKEFQESAKNKKEKQSGKSKRAHSSDPPKIRNQQQTAKPVKLSDKPITLNIFEMISMTKKSKEGRLDVISKSHKAETIKKGPNFLDSTAVAKRGKEREKPKEKKPTKLRKVILKDRMLRRSKFLQSLGLLETRSLERLNVEYDLPLVVEDDVPKIEFPSHTSILEHLQDVDPRVLTSLHSRRFREYCNQVVNKEINECCTVFLKELVRFQDNQFHKDPVKARMRRRLVFGLREVLKFLGVKKIKCVIISPNVEKVQSEGGLEEKIEKIITGCQVNNIPFIFALSRRQLGFTCLKKVPVSVVGILNYDGAETYFQQLKELTESAREKYREMVTKLTEELTTLDIEDKPDLAQAECGETSSGGCAMQGDDELCDGIFHKL